MSSSSSPSPSTMAVGERPTVKVSNIPKTAIAKQPWNFLESKLGPNTIYALDFATAHKNWKSRGFGRVQFEALQGKGSAELLSLKGDFVFKGSSLSISATLDDIIVRPIGPSNQIDSGVLHAGFLVEEDCMLVLESWEGVKILVMPERNRVEFWLGQCGERYKLDIPFDDILESCTSCFGGWESQSAAFEVISHLDHVLEAYVLFESATNAVPSSS